MTATEIAAGLALVLLWLATMTIAGLFIRALDGVVTGELRTLSA